LLPLIVAACIWFAAHSRSLDKPNSQPNDRPALVAGLFLLCIPVFLMFRRQAVECLQTKQPRYLVRTPIPGL
jgi:hypothetical protein